MPEPTRAELAPVLGAYGNAVFTCTLLESGLRLLLAVASHALKSRGEPNPVDPAKSEKARMLGDLFPLALQYTPFSEPERKQVWAAIRLRNLLIHNYWTPETTFVLLKPKGRDWVAADLEAKREQIRDADRIISGYVNKYLSEHGLSIESITAPTFAEYEPNPGPPESLLR
jgi:hypothetical protein